MKLTAVDWHDSSLSPFLFIEVDYSTCLSFVFQTVLLCNPDWPLTWYGDQAGLNFRGLPALPILHGLEMPSFWGRGGWWRARPRVRAWCGKRFWTSVTWVREFYFLYKSLKLILPRIQEILLRTSQTASILLAWVGRVCVWVRVLLCSSVWHEIVYTRLYIEFHLPLPLECRIS